MNQETKSLPNKLIIANFMWGGNIKGKNDINFITNAFLKNIPTFDDHKKVKLFRDGVVDKTTKVEITRFKSGLK